MTIDTSSPSPTGLAGRQPEPGLGPAAPRGMVVDRTLTVLVLGIVCASGGLIGMFLSLSRVRPEPEVFRQFPYLISAVISTGFFVVGALLVLGHFLWRAYNETRTLTRELEEAAASLMWEQLGLGSGSPNGSGKTTTPPARAEPRRARGR